MIDVADEIPQQDIGHEEYSRRITGNEGASPVTLAVLGDVTLSDGDGAEVPLSPQRAHILAVLAAAAGSVVSRSNLLEDLWGEDTEASRHRLKTQVAQIRSALAPDLSVEFRFDGYRLCGSLERLDSTLFESLVTGARQLDTAAAADQYARALRLWRGPAAFVGVDSLLVDAARRPLERLRIRTAVALADCEIELLSPRLSVELLQDIFDGDQSEGDVTARLATLLAMSGRQIQGMRVIARHREALKQLGWSPTADVVDLEERILRHDHVVPALVAPAPSHRRDDGFHLADGLITRSSLEQSVLDALAIGPVIVCGEAGVGKTVLAAAIVSHLEDSGRGVVRVNARPDPTRPMEVMADIIEQFGLLYPGSLKEQLDDAAAAAAVARISGHQAKHARAISRDQLIAQLVALVGAVASTNNLVLVVEDAHWLDNSSAEILGQLIARKLADLLVTSRRPLADDFGQDWSGASVVEVPAFSMTEVRQLVDLSLPVRASDDLAERLHQTTGGNGLFLRLKLDLLADGQLGRDLPPTLLHAVHERTAGFSRTTREVLQTAALLGQTFPLAPLVRVHPHLHDTMRDAVDERLVRLDDEAGIGEFVHGLVVDALIEVMPPAVRVARHDQLCRALVALGDSPIAVAKQAVGAEELDPLRVVLCCLAAAREQAEVFDWASTIEWGRLGLGAGDRHGVDDQKIEAELRTLVGQGLRRSNLAGSDTELGRACDLAYALEDHELFVRCVTELCLHGPTTRAGTVDPAARLQLERALASPVGDLQRAELLSAAATLLSLSDEWTLGRSLYRQALDLVEAAAEPEGLRAIRINAHLGLSHPDDLDVRRTAAAGLLGLDDHDAQWEGNFLQFGLSLIDADRSKLETSIDRLRALTSIVKQRRQQRAMDQVETVTAFIRGDLDDAARLAEVALHSSLESYPESWANSIYAALVVPIREAQGRVAELGPHIAGLLASSPDFITWHALAACVAYAEGDADLMASELDFVARHDFRFIEDLTWTAVATITCRPIWAMNLQSAAAVVYQRLVPYAGLMTWNGLSTHGPVDAGLACLAAVLGDSAGLSGHLEQSRTLVGRLGAPHLLWPELGELSGRAEQRDPDPVPQLG